MLKITNSRKKSWLPNFKYKISERCSHLQSMEKNTKAMDEAISIEEVTKNDKQFWKIYIHISSIHQYIKVDSDIDKESAKQVQSY